MKPGPKRHTVTQRTLYKPKDDPSEGEEIQVGWNVPRRMYKKVQNIHQATGCTMRELQVEALKELIKKYRKKGVIDKKGNPLI